MSISLNVGFLVLIIRTEFSSHISLNKILSSFDLVLAHVQGHFKPMIYRRN